MSDNVGTPGGFLSLYIWRIGRWFVYSMLGAARPAWRHAKAVLRASEDYSDLGTANPDVYMHPYFRENLDALERELRRVRRGGEPGGFELPFDFPPGAAERVRARLRQT